MRIDVELRVILPDDDEAAAAAAMLILRSYGIDRVRVGALRSIAFRPDDPRWRRLVDELREAGASCSYMDVPVVEPGEIERAEWLQLDIVPRFAVYLEREEQPDGTWSTPRLSRDHRRALRERDIDATETREVVVSDRVLAALGRDALTGWTTLPFASPRAAHRSPAARLSYSRLWSDSTLPPIDEATMVEAGEVPKPLAPGWFYSMVGQPDRHGCTIVPRQRGPLVYRRHDVSGWKDFNLTRELWDAFPWIYRPFVISPRAWIALKPFANRRISVWPVVLVP